MMTPEIKETLERLRVIQEEIEKFLEESRARREKLKKEFRRWLL